MLSTQKPTPGLPAQNARQQEKVPEALFSRRRRTGQRRGIPGRSFRAGSRPLSAIGTDGGSLRILPVSAARTHTRRGARTARCGRGEARTAPRCPPPPPPHGRSSPGGRPGTKRRDAREHRAIATERNANPWRPPCRTARPGPPRTRRSHGERRGERHLSRSPPPARSPSCRHGAGTAPLPEARGGEGRAAQGRAAAGAGPRCGEAPRDSPARAAAASGSAEPGEKGGCGPREGSAGAPLLTGCSGRCTRWRWSRCRRSAPRRCSSSGSRGRCRPQT